MKATDSKTYHLWTIFGREVYIDIPRDMPDEESERVFDKAREFYRTFEEQLEYLHPDVKIRSFDVMAGPPPK